MKRSIMCPPRCLAVSHHESQFSPDILVGLYKPKTICPNPRNVFSEKSQLMKSLGSPSQQWPDPRDCREENTFQTSRVDDTCWWWHHFTLNSSIDICMSLNHSIWLISRITFNDWSSYSAVQCNIWISIWFNMAVLPLFCCCSSYMRLNSI